MKEVVGQVPLYWSKLAFKFLQFQNHSIRVAFTGKKVYRGAGLGLEIPVDYFFYGESRVITWFKNSIGKLDLCIDEKVGIGNIFIFRVFKFPPKFGVSSIER